MNFTRSGFAGFVKQLGWYTTTVAFVLFFYEGFHNFSRLYDHSSAYPGSIIFNHADHLNEIKQSLMHNMFVFTQSFILIMHVSHLFISSWIVVALLPQQLLQFISEQDGKEEYVFLKKCTGGGYQLLHETWWVDVVAGKFMKIHFLILSSPIKFTMQLYAFHHRAAGMQVEV